MQSQKTELFEFNLDPKRQPLAERCRPDSLKDIFGHDAFIGPDSPLRKQMESDFLPSLIFWGPPGVGKTTIARLLAKQVGFEFTTISAVSSGVREVKEIIENARRQLQFYNKRTVLFIDEIHRFNKAQQDSLLHTAEDGTLVLIGATTENPSFEIISPLLSRSQIIKLEPLNKKDMEKVIKRAVKKDVFLKEYQISIKGKEALLFFGSGDARRTLNLLETSFHLADKKNKKITISEELVKNAASQNTLYYDKKGEFHYDIISAFIKSVRGSDPDAAVYWLARMLNAGEDPVFIARRLIVLASEDIGNAEPYALSLANAGFEAVRNIGMPEARIVLAQVTTYLASVPKSNAAYQAVESAYSEIQKSGLHQVPLHLRNAPTKLMKDLNYGAGYKYPHDYPQHFTGQDYLPEKLSGRIFYNPTEMGREAKLKIYLKQLWPQRRESGLVK